MLNLIKGLLPLSIRILYTNFLVRRKYEVVFEEGASAGKSTFFEGKNLLKKNAQVHNSHIGLGTYVSGNANLNKAKIGRFCSIGQNVSNSFGIHPTEWISTHPCFYSMQKQAGFTFVNNQLFEEHRYIDENNKYLIQIGNDVWIGNDVKIMDGVCIGDGAIVGTGAVVTKDVEPYSIVGGIPAKLIRYRFTKEMIAILLEINWWGKDRHWLEKNAHLFFSGKISISDLKHLKDLS